MKTILKTIGVYVLSFVVLYLMGSFISLEPNVAEWGRESRFILIGLPIPFTIAYVVYNHLNPYN